MFTPQKLIMKLYLQIGLGQQLTTLTNSVCRRFLRNKRRDTLCVIFVAFIRVIKRVEYVIILLTMILSDPF